MTIKRMQSIAVKHNIEVAHRLFELPGKCEQIHGHSMWVTMELFGPVNAGGILAGIEYGDLKKTFRKHLDEEYDHRLLLNASDPFSRPLHEIVDVRLQSDPNNPDVIGIATTDSKQIFLPGLNTTPGDPTTENISEWVANWMAGELQGYDLYSMEVTVWETSVNMAKTVIGLERP